MPKRLTTPQWIANACVVHGDTYDYSRTVYVNALTRLEIGCRVPGHGTFWQKPPDHVSSGAGCPLCGADRTVAAQRKTLDTFLAEARKTHGDRYDYSQVVYRNTHSKVTIICPVHGPFLQGAKVHIMGSGCSDCSGYGPLTTEGFLRKARLRHGERYDYSEVVYTGCRDPITIICADHGRFKQDPNSHLNGRGCPTCGLALVRSMQDDRRMTTEQVIERARAIHGDLYDYSKAVYTGMLSKFTVICREPHHGEFYPTAANHIHLGSGCPACSNSRGEIGTAKALEQYRLRFIKQWQYPPSLFTRSRRLMRADFLLTDHRIIIEYDGIQHYEPVRFRGISHARADKLFKGTQERDRLKNEWAADNGYVMIRIPYWEDVAAFLDLHLLPLLKQPPAEAADCI